MQSVSNFKYRGIKMFLWKLASELQNLVKESWAVLEMQKKMQIEFTQPPGMSLQKFWHKKNATIFTK